MGIFTDIFGDGGAGAARDQAARTQRRLNMERRQRERRIDRGEEVLDKRFARFDDAYYDRFAKAFEGFYQPQVQEQYVDTKDRLQANLMDRGVLAGTIGAQELGRIDEAFSDETASVASKGVSAANDLRGRVESERSDLSALNQAAADPKLIGSRARGAATTLAAAPSFDPLENVFSAFLQPVAAYTTAQNNALPQRTRASPTITPTVRLRG